MSGSAAAPVAPVTPPTGTTTGYPVSTAPAATQAQDGDGLLALQTDPTGVKRLHQMDPRTLHASYILPGAVLLGAGPGASRGLAGAAVPPGGEPLIGYVLDATLQVVEPPFGAPAGTMPILRAVTGVAGTAVALDASLNAHVPGATISIGIANDFAITRDPNTGEAVLSIKILDVEDGYNPVPGSRRLYSNGGNLRIAR